MYKIETETETHEAFLLNDTAFYLQPRTEFNVKNFESRGRKNIKMISFAF